MNWGCVEEVSVEDYDKFDPQAVVNSPRSLKACAKEGVLPSELIYKPLELFSQPGVEVEVAEMRGQFAEARRQDLIDVVKFVRQAFVDRENMGITEEPGLFGVGSQEPYYMPAHTKEWFNDRLFLINPNACSPSTNNKEGDANNKAKGGAAASSSTMTRATSDPGISPKASGKTAAGGDEDELLLLQEQTDQQDREHPMMDGGSSPMSMRSTHSKGKTFGSKGGASTNRFGNSTVKEVAPTITGLLTHMRSVPRSDRIEFDATTVMENHLMTKRVRDSRDRSKGNRKAKELNVKCVESAKANFAFMLNDREEEAYMAEFRAQMSLPPSMANSGRIPSFVKADSIREKVNGFTTISEHKWKTALDTRTGRQHERTELLTDNFYMKKFQVSTENMEERIRFRYQNDIVCKKREDYEAEKLRMFQKRAEDMRNKLARESSSAAMRKELRDLRDVNRLMTENQRARKLEYVKMRKREVNQDIKDKKAAKHNMSKTWSGGESGSFGIGSGEDGLESPMSAKFLEDALSPSGNTREKNSLPMLARQFTHGNLALTM